MPINANSANPRPEGAKSHWDSFFTIIDPNLGPVGLQITIMALIMILGTSHSTQEAKKIGLG